MKVSVFVCKDWAPERFQFILTLQNNIRFKFVDMRTDSTKLKTINDLNVISIKEQMKTTNLAMIWQPSVCFYNKLFGGKPGKSKDKWIYN